MWAQLVNRAAGGVVVAPWDIADMPEEWLEAAVKLAVELPQMRKGRAEVARIVEEIKKRHQNG